MNQRASIGMSLLDIAKSAVEQLLTKLAPMRIERYFLISSEDGPGAVKARNNHSKYMFTCQLCFFRLVGVIHIPHSFRR